MQVSMDKKKICHAVEITLILILCAITLLLDFVRISYLSDELRNKLLSKFIQQACGAIAAGLLLHRLGIRLFGKPQQLLYLIPCLIIAIDNFQFYAYFSGKMELVHKEAVDFILFGLYCLSVGLFEELIFRGIIFSVLASRFSKDKKGLWQTFIVSSLIFGAAHLFNGFSMGTLLQVGYTMLTGGLFAFTLMKTKNLFCCALIHSVYNFCGLLFDSSERMGLGAGVVLDLGTALTMLVVCVSVGIFVLYSVKRYDRAEQTELYEKLGISIKEADITEDKTEG